MTKPVSFGELDFRTVSTLEDGHGIPEPETPFRILIIGDFTGSHSMDTSPDISGRKVLEVDRDNLDQVMERLGVTARLRFDSDEDTELMLMFKELEDFHPDSLFERLEIFKRLRQTRAALDDARTFEKAAMEVRSWSKADTGPGTLSEPADKPRSPEPSPRHSASLLDDILDEVSPTPARISAGSGQDPWKSFLHRIVGPHIIRQDEDKKQELTSTVDEAVSSLMRMILHHRDFQAMEAAWKAVHFLVSRLETDSHLKVYILDISKQELSADVKATEALSSTELYRVLVEKSINKPGADPWSVIAGSYTFENSLYDAEVLGRIARIARMAGAPFISAAHPRIVGCESLAATPDSDDWTDLIKEEDGSAWEALRHIPEASYLGLAMPGFLLRLPYGRETDPAELFGFEEMNTAEHDDYLWGNPCIACILLLAQAFTKDGWDMRPGTFLEIKGLPLHVFQTDGETAVEPCTGVLLTDKACDVILEGGIMPLVSFKDTDTIRLVRFQSFHDPLSRLAGRWEQAYQA